jgi:hypothetical protein
MVWRLESWLDVVGDPFCIGVAFKSAIIPRIGFELINFFLVGSGVGTIVGHGVGSAEGGGEIDGMSVGGPQGAADGLAKGILDGLVNGTSVRGSRRTMSTIPWIGFRFLSVGGWDIGDSGGAAAGGPRRIRSTIPFTIFLIGFRFLVAVGAGDIDGIEDGRREGDAEG